MTREPESAYLPYRTLESYHTPRTKAMNLTIDVTSDVICPWCYVGKRRLEKAVALAGRGDVRVGNLDHGQRSVFGYSLVRKQLHQPVF